MVTLYIPYMDLSQIAASGQCFTWRALEEGGYLISSRGRSVTARQSGERFTFSCTEEEFDRHWRGYFDLDTDYAAIQAAIDPADLCLSAAASFGRGIRVLRQDFWEVMVCFLISQNNHIARITRSVRALCQTYGHAGAFPRPDELLGADEADFIALGLGYRAKYLTALAHTMSGGGLEELEEALSVCDDESAVAALTALYGIGKKVADCILLFGLHRADFFPLDTHIRQILARHYPGGFPFDRYKGCLGILQQYLFYYDLKRPVSP